MTLQNNAISSPERPILITGAGIGGLSAAIALARTGHHVHLLEQADGFSEVGAGIQLGPNATRLLRAWQVDKVLLDHIAKPDAILLNDGISGQPLATVPLGQEIARRYGAPYLTMHRAALQNALLECARRFKTIRITNSFCLARFTRVSKTVRVISTDGRQNEGCLLVGADGVRSRVRAYLHSKSLPVYGNKSAWRLVLDQEDVPDFARSNHVGLWMGPNAHLVHYPVDARGAVNIVAVIDDLDATPAWNAAGSAHILLSHFEHWHDTPRSFLQSSAVWNKWSLFELATPLARWGEGLVTLLGDAAHPPVPFLAQGGAMAIEDAALLAHFLSPKMCPTQYHIFTRLRDYETKRAPRAHNVLAASRRMGRIYHLSGPGRAARNFVIRHRSAPNLLKGFDWLYGHHCVDVP